MSKKKTEFQETPIVEEQHEIDKLRREYVEKQIMPWLIAHLQMRSTGMQVFTCAFVG